MEHSVSCEQIEMARAAIGQYFTPHNSVPREGSVHQGNDVWSLLSASAATAERRS
jgi:hypothetical protein